MGPERQIFMAMLIFPLFIEVLNLQNFSHRLFNVEKATNLKLSKIKQYKYYFNNVHTVEYFPSIFSSKFDCPIRNV